MGEAAIKATRPDAPWYIVHTNSGYEARVVERIRIRVVGLGLEQDVLDVVAPDSLPGYVLLHAHLTDACYRMVKETPKVTGFHGTGGKPMALSRDEVDQILNKPAENGIER